MASAVTEVAAGLLIFICIAEGTLSLNIEYKESLNATVGQNISLPCIVSLEHDTNIAQIQWLKKGVQDQNMLVYNPSHSTHYFMEDWYMKLHLVYSTDRKSPHGSILHLYNILKNQSGTYVCAIATFPDGFFKRETKVYVTEPQVSLKVHSPFRTLIEGDEVNITCSSDPPADVYLLQSSKSNLSLESLSGDFTIPGITRHIKDLICQPLWNSSAPHLQNLRGSMSLTVDFLDITDCNSSSKFEVETGTNLTITCGTKSSKSINYIWKKGNTTMSHNANISLWFMNSDDSGLYSLTVYMANTRLQKQSNFTVVVFNRTQTEHLGSTVPMETSQFTDATTTATRAATMTTEGQNFYSTTPSAGNYTTLHSNGTALNTTLKRSTAAQSEMSTRSCCKKQNTSGLANDSKDFTLSPTSIFTTTSTKDHHLFRTTVRTVKNITESHTVTVDSLPESSSGRTAVYFLFPLILVLVLVAFLYRRYLIQKRMDLPPPFKPPPPPVKYTSVRRQEEICKIAMTNILV